MEGTSCQPRDGCAKNNGGCAHVCTNTLNGHNCSCFPPPNSGETAGWPHKVWQLSTNGYDCLDIDECADPAFTASTCRSETHYCINKPGYWECIQRGLIVAKSGAVLSQRMFQILLRSTCVKTKLCNSLEYKCSFTSSRLVKKWLMYVNTC